MHSYILSRRKMKTIEEVRKFLNDKIVCYEEIIEANRKAKYMDTVMVYEFRKHHYMDIIDFLDEE